MNPTSRPRVSIHRLTAALLLALACAGPALAQIIRGGISGTVRDTSGGVVPGARVTVTHMDTNRSRATVSQAHGFYRVAALDPGRYVVRAELTGFNAAEARDIGVRSASDTTVDVELSVAGVGETLTVTQELRGVELNKTSPTISQTSAGRQAVELPLNADRNINNLIALTPNAIRTTGQGTYAVNGQRSRNNNYMLDGSDNNDISVTISNAQLVPEAVAEFQVLTNPYSAEFGRNSGAQVNVVTRSGTNAFRGEAWDYYTTSDLYSLTNLEKASGLTSPARFNRHQIGGNLGGPVFRDRTFFFLLYQYDAQRPGPTLGPTTRMPTPAGYAALPGVPLGAGQPPASRQAVLQRLSFLRDVYASGVSFRNPRTTLVNGVPIETGEANVPLSSPSTWQTALARVDHRLGGTDNLTIRYHLDDWVFTNAASNCTFGAVFCGNGSVEDTNLAASEIHTFSPSLLNEARLSWVRREITQVENDPQSPTASITGLFTIGGASNYPQGRLDDAFQLSDTLTLAKGRHTLKLGADIRYNHVRNWAAFNSKGSFSFNSLQDYVNNLAVYVSQALQTASYQAPQWQTSFFVQDDLRATPDLTLNLGLRYELSEVPLGMFGATDPESLGALVPGPPGKDTNNWAPRVGFAGAPASGGGSSATAGRCCAAASAWATT